MQAPAKPKRTRPARRRNRTKPFANAPSSIDINSLPLRKQLSEPLLIRIAVDHSKIRKRGIDQRDIRRAPRGIRHDLEHVPSQPRKHHSLLQCGVVGHARDRPCDHDLDAGAEEAAEYFVECRVGALDGPFGSSRVRGCCEAGVSESGV